MNKMKLLLLTISNCGACKALKNNLDKLQTDSGFDYSFEYEVINVEKHPELVEKYGMTSAPLLVFPTGLKLNYSLGVSGLRGVILEQQLEYENNLLDSRD